MTNRERERKTLDFAKQSELDGRGSIEETFYPWVLTTQRFKKEGMPADIADGARDITNDLDGNAESQKEKYFPVAWGEGVMEYEKYLGFDPVRRIHFVLPFRRFEEKIIEKTPEHTVRQDVFGRYLELKTGGQVETEYRYLTEAKIAAAKALMLQPEALLVGEIAEKVGFKDQFYFSKVFKSSTGYTPRDYRKQYLQKNDE